MINEYLILEVDENKNNFKSALLTEEEAEAHVKRYCENGDISFIGLENYRYFPRWFPHHTCFLIVSPVDGSTRIGNFWRPDEETKEVIDVFPNNADY